MAEKKSFSGLLPEIKSLIVEHILRPTDLRHICLVNKQLHELAVRSLYRCVSLDLGSSTDTRLSAFLNPRNIGLKHIRTLRLNIAPSGYGKMKGQKQMVHFAVRMLLEFLPEDVLEVVRWDTTRLPRLTFTLANEEFDSWCPWEHFSADNLLSLYKKQRHMKSLEVMNLDRDVLPQLKKSQKLQENIFSHTTKLLLYPEDRDTLARGGFFVEKTTENLEELLIHAHFDSDLPDLGLHLPGTIDSRELNDSATAPGLLSTMTFACMAPFEKCTPFPKLRSLRLHRINLRHCEETWLKFIDFTNIHDLRFDQCLGADSLLGHLCKASHLPKKLRTLEFQHKDNDEDEALVTLDGFLCLVSGLEEIHIDIEHVKSLPAAASIIRHGKTLEVINVHCSPEHSQSTGSSSDNSIEELVWSFEDFNRICDSCPLLEQVSCAWPPTSLIRRPSEDYLGFERTVGNLRNLVTLHITTLPNSKPYSTPLPKYVYETLLQSLAQRILDPFSVPPPPPPPTPTFGAPPPPPPPAPVGGNGSHFPSTDPDDSDDDNLPAKRTPAHPKLRLLAFGFSDKIYERQEPSAQFIFLRSTCQDAYGHTKPYATRIGWCHRLFEEPRSDVLDFVLHRDVKTMWRDRGEGIWGNDEDDPNNFNHGVVAPGMHPMPMPMPMPPLPELFP